MATDVIKQIVAISADLSGLRSDLSRVEGEFKSTFGRIKGLAAGALGALGIGFSVGTIISGTKAVLDLADSLQNLSEQTGLSVELLSGLKSPLEEADTSMDAFARGVFNLQKNLGNIDKDTDPAARAIKRLGLDVNDLRNSTPDDFVRKVTDALGQIENPTERTTVLFNLLGKSSQELGPALQQLAGRFAEYKANGLSAADVAALDAVGDAMTRLTNQALALGAQGVAGLLRFLNVMRDAPAVAAKIDAATKQFASRAGISIERVKEMSAKEIIQQAEQPTRFADPAGMRFARDELLNLREEFERLNKLNITKAIAPFKGISDGAKKAKDDVKNLTDTFLEGLEKQIESLENRKIELQFGDQAALGAKLDADLERFKENLRDKQLPIPKGLDDFFKVLRDRIVAADSAVRELADSMAEMTARQEAFAADANEGVGQVGRTAEEVRREFEALKQFDELSRQLAIGAIDTRTSEGREQARIAGIVEEFDKTKAKLEELGYAAGKTQEEIAAGVADAWNKATQEINGQTDELTRFQERAFERMHDAFSDLFRDALSGEIKSWEDAGNRIKKVMDDIVSEFLAMQLKIAVLGPDYGKSGGSGGTGQIGGLIGQIIGLFGGGAGGGLTSGANGLGAGLGANFIFAHGGGPVGADTPELAKRMISGLKSDEQLIVGQDGEFVLSREAVRGIGIERLKYANEHFTLPRFHDGGMIGMAEMPSPAPAATDRAEVSSSPAQYHLHVHGATNPDEFRRSRAQWEASMARIVRKGEKRI